MVASALKHLQWLAVPLGVLVLASAGSELAIHFEAGEWDREAITRWLGTAVAVSGLVMASPDGFRVLAAAAIPPARRLRGWLARWLPFLRRNPTVHVGTARGTLWADMTASGTVTRNWAEDQPLEAQVERLRVYVAALFSITDSLHAKIAEQASDLRTQLSQMNDKWDTSLDQVRRDLRALSDRSATIDARALPVVALGILLTGLSPELSSWLPWAALLAVLLATPVVVALMSRWTWRRP